MKLADTTIVQFLANIVERERTWGTYFISKDIHREDIYFMNLPTILDYAGVCRLFMCITPVTEIQSQSLTSEAYIIRTPGIPFFVVPFNQPRSTMPADYAFLDYHTHIIFRITRGTHFEQCITERSSVLSMGVGADIGGLLRGMWAYRAAEGEES